MMMSMREFPLYYPRQFYSNNKRRMQRKTTSFSGTTPPQASKTHPQTPPAPSTQQMQERNAASAFDARITNPEISSGQQTLQKLLEMNEDYLRDKVKVSDVPRPSKYAYKLPSKTGSSQYNRKYTSLTRVTIEGSTPQRDKTGSIMRLPSHQVIEYASTYHNDFTDKQQQMPPTPAKTPKKYEKSQAPRFIESSYHRDYQSVASSPATSAKRAEVKLMGGGKLSSDTTYKQCYRLKTIDSGQACRPIVHKDNKIFITMVNPPQTAYRQNFNREHKRIQPEGSCKPRQKYTPAPNRQKYKTEYGEEFVGQKISQKQEFQCMSREELKHYVMTILKE